jgi:hypothetical protein
MYLSNGLFRCKNDFDGYAVLSEEPLDGNHHRFIGDMPLDTGGTAFL